MSEEMKELIATLKHISEVIIIDIAYLEKKLSDQTKDLI